jgi:hypothetical protein
MYKYVPSRHVDVTVPPMRITAADTGHHREEDGSTTEGSFVLSTCNAQRNATIRSLFFCSATHDA